MIQNCNHKYHAHLIWIDCSLLLDSVGLDPTRSCSVCTPLHRLPVLLAPSLKAQSAREICAQRDGRQTGKSNVSVSLSRGCDVGSRRCVTRHRPRVRRTFEKEPPSWPASSQPSIRIPLSLSLQWPRCVSLISCTIFHRCADGKERRKGETSVGWGERQTNQFERPDKCNNVKVYFRAPSKWVLRYYITLFIQAPSLNYSVCAHAMCVNVCPSAPVRTCPCLAL